MEVLFLCADANRNLISCIDNTMDPATASNVVIQRALKLLECQRRASRNYYAKNRDVIKAKSVTYWENHREAINARRRLRYQESHEKPEEKQELR